jgi:hypothetical protein
MFRSHYDHLQLEIIYVRILLTARYYTDIKTHCLFTYKNTNYSIKSSRKKLPTFLCPQTYLHYEFTSDIFYNFKYLTLRIERTSFQKNQLNYFFKHNSQPNTCKYFSYDGYLLCNNSKFTEEYWYQNWSVNIWNNHRKLLTATFNSRHWDS